MKGSTQAVLTLIAGSVVVYMYQKGKQKLQGKSDSGIDPKWNDPVITERHDRQLQEGKQSYPSCQIWDDVYQVFIDTGDANANASQDACFSRYTDAQNARYIVGPGIGQTIWRRGNGIIEPDSANGQCWFQAAGDPGPWTSNPPVVFGQLVPPNRSSRLCFASGETADTAGRYFVQNPNTGNAVTYYQPAASFTADQPPETHPLGATDLPATRCEFNLDSRITRDFLHEHSIPLSNNIVAWFYDPSLPQNMEGCLAASSSTTPTRYADGESFIFKNTITGKIEQLKDEVY